MFDDLVERGSLVIIIMSILAIFLSGIFFGVAYYVMDVTEDGFKNSDCVIDNNVFVDDCQDLWDLSVYPFLALRTLLVWMSFFFIFSLVIGMLILGYRSGKSPVLMGLLVTFSAILTYGGIEISNVYRSMLDVTIFRNMMVPFTVYNKIMLYFPWFVFIITIFSLMLSLVNYQKTKVNSAQEELNY